MARQSLTAMVMPGKSAETWQALMELRCKREVLERWLASQVLPETVQQSLRAMLGEVEEQLRLLTQALSS
jgi:hypothetical protein